MFKKTAVIELRIELDPAPGAYNDPEDWVTILNHGALSNNYKAKAKLLRVEGPFEEDTES